MADRTAETAQADTSSGELLRSALGGIEIDRFLGLLSSAMTTVHEVTVSDVADDTVLDYIDEIGWRLKPYKGKLRVISEAQNQADTVMNSALAQDSDRTNHDLLLGQRDGVLATLLALTLYANDTTLDLSGPPLSDRE